MPLDLSATDRASLLRYASQITSAKDDPVAVSATAIPLLEWAESAPDEADLRLRMQALSQHHRNTQHAQPSDDPASFVVAAKTYHAFLAAGSGGRTALDDALDHLAGRAAAARKFLHGFPGPDGSQEPR